MKRIFLLLFSLLTFTIYINAQGFGSPESNSFMRSLFKQCYEVKGRVFGVDDFEPKPYPLQGANIKVTCVGDTTNTDGQSAWKDGRFDVWVQLNERLKDTRLKVVISYVGMETIEKICTPKKSKENGVDKYTVDLDSFVMKSMPMTAEEVEIVGELKKMYQRGDTVIFNAQAYDMPSGSVLLDLVRRLPGLKYDNGKMTYLGKDINEIRLNGDQFFKRDMSIALNNMPHEKLKSLKVYEVPDDTMNVTSDNHLVMDMVTKDPMNKTIFADVSVGTTEKFNHYEYGGNISLWVKKGPQISGGFNTSDIPGQGVYQLKSVNTNGNLSYEQNLGKINIDVYGSHNYNNNQNKSDNYSKLFMPDYTQNSMSSSTSGSRSKSWNVGTQFNGNFSERVFWYSRISMDKSDGNNDSESVDSISNEGEGLVSTTRQVNTSKNSSKSFDVQYGMSIYLDKERRDEIYMNVSYGNNDSKNTSFNKSYSRFVQLGDSVRDVNHRISSPDKSHNMGFEVGFGHKLWKNTHLRFTYNFNYSKNTSVQNYEDILADGGFRNVDSLHYDKMNKELSNNFQIMYFYNNKKSRFNTYFNFRPTKRTIDNNQYGKDEYLTDNGLNFSLNSDWRQSFSFGEMDWRYQCSNSLPSVEQLSSVIDYTDPMNISSGNPNLKTSFTHNFEYEFQLKSWMRFNMNYGFTTDQITSLTILDKETGVRRTSPTNINGSWNTREYIFMTFPIHDFTLNYKTEHTFNHNVSFVQNSTDYTSQKSATNWHNISCSVDGSYGNKYWQFRGGVGYTFDYNKSNYLSDATKGHKITASANINYTAPFGLEIGTDCDFNKPFGYEMAAANKTECIWNCRAGYRFLKHKLATLSFEWRDILNSYNGFNASMSSTSWNESKTYGDNSMCVVSFNYRFNSF